MEGFMTTDPENKQQPKYRQYNPYQDLTINPQLKKLYNLPTSPEHLFDEERNRKHRGWGERLTFYTGVSYGAGSIIGGIKGTLHGVAAAELGDSLKIRASRVLSSAGLAGRGLGNSAAVLGLMYAGYEGLITWQRDTADDVFGSALAGFCTGFTYRMVKGVQSAVVAGAVGAVAAGLAFSGKKAVKRYLPA